MNEELRHALIKFKDALNRLREGADQARDELDKDGVIQRFEFTFELMWKALKVHLETEGIQCKTPKECLRSAFRTGLMEDEETFLNMLEDRNRTSHIYSKAESEKIFHNIKTIYLPSLAKLSAKLEKAFSSNER